MRGIAGSWLITGDVADAPLAGGAVVLDGAERVVAIGEGAELRRAHPGVPFQDLRAVLMPGLVNAHTHLELCALRGRVTGGHGFVPWVEAMLAARANAAPEQDLEAIEAGVSELLAAGTVAVGEVSNSLAAVPALATAPLRACVFHEVYGMRKDTGETMLGLAVQRRAEFADFPAHLRYAPAPHTPYSLHPDVLQQIVARARALGQRTSLHLCEHAAERAYLLDGGGPFAAFARARGSSPVDWTPPACDPVRYAQRLGVLGPDVICVHLADARPDEVAVIAKSGSPVVLCPRSNLRIELRLPPLLDLLAAGVRPALGTDSLASNATLDVLDEARALAERFPSAPARVLLAMATSYGADTLGFGEQLGRLRPGLRPGLLAFEHAGAAPADPERFLLSRAAATRSVLSRPDPRDEPPATQRRTA